MDIIIKRADKGSATVVMSLEDYVAEAMLLLNNTQNYRLIDEDPTEQFSQDISDFLEEMFRCRTIK